MENMMDIDNIKWLFQLTQILAGLVAAAGASTSCALFLFFLRDLKLSQQDIRQLYASRSIVWVGNLLFIVSSIGLVPWTRLELAFAQAMLFLILVTLVNGLFYSFWLEPNLHKMTFNFQVLHGRKDSMKLWRKMTYASFSVSVISWYSAFVLVMCKHLDIHSMALLYLGLMICSVILSQATERFIFKVHLGGNHRSRR